MEEQKYYFKISRENIIGDIITVPFTGETDITVLVDPCCPITSTTVNTLTGTTGYYLPMSYLLSGGTNGQSLLTCLTIPLLFTQTAIDIGYYTPFDGAVLQKDVVMNFLWSADTTSPYNITFFNTSDNEFKKFLSLSNYVLDWGDGTPVVNLTNSNPIQHTYVAIPNDYVIKLKSVSPWGISTIEKPLTLPYTGVTIDNQNGTAYFTPIGCNWSGTPISYDYIFTGDSNTNLIDFDSSNYTTVPFLITGFTQSSVNDLVQYGPKFNLFGGKFKLNIPITGNSGTQGVYFGPDPTDTYTAYTIDNVLYWDLSDGTTIYFISSYGIDVDLYTLSAITKNEALMNVIDEPAIESELFIERGKVSGLETMQRLGEIDNLGDISKYGYGFFKVKKF
jgi:hypothetical protein